MREAFGTYMDKEVAALILSGQFPRRASRSTSRSCSATSAGSRRTPSVPTATEVVATLNRMFEVMVPIVDRHGGHVDKFIGDGLLAVFGAPEAYPDHADRAVAAACEIVGARSTGAMPGCGWPPG